MTEPPSLRMPPVIEAATPAQLSQTHGEVDVEVWPEDRVPNRRLGAHRDLDRRRHQFGCEVTAGWLLPPQTVAWDRHVRIFDQGNCAASCAVAIVGALGSEPFLRAEMRQTPIQLPSGESTTLFDIRQAQYTVDLAMRVYEQATHVDGIGNANTVWPKSDPGTTVDAVCQVVRGMGLITGWGHCMGVTSVPHALQVYGPALVTIPWYEGFDEPAPGGAELRVAGRRRGGATLLCRRYEHGDSEDTSWFWLDGNWGLQYGESGTVSISAATLRALYKQGAHAVVLKTGDPRA